MSKIDLKKLRLLNKDILITPSDRKVSEIIEVIEDNPRQKKMNYFYVVRVSPTVTEVKEGDEILLEFNDHTIPFRYENKSYAITDEEKIVGVVEE